MRVTIAPTAPSSWALPQVDARLPLPRLERPQSVPLGDKPPSADGRAVLLFRIPDGSVTRCAVLLEDCLRHAAAAGELNIVGCRPCANSLQVDIAVAVC